MFETWYSSKKNHNGWKLSSSHETISKCKLKFPLSCIYVCLINCEEPCSFCSLLANFLEMKTSWKKHICALFSLCNASHDIWGKSLNTAAAMIDRFTIFIGHLLCSRNMVLSFQLTHLQPIIFLPLINCLKLKINQRTQDILLLLVSFFSN